MPEFQESMRYDYPLTEKSTVWSIGGYKCAFAFKIHDKFGCHVNVFEPIREFFVSAVKAAGDRDVYFYNYGLGAKTETLKFYKKEDGTGFIEKKHSTPEMVEIRDIKSEFIEFVDLMKVNIEGMEYDLMDGILDAGLMANIRFLQIQFHPIVPDAKKRYEDIRNRLVETHKLMWSYPWIWESWELK